MEITRFDIPGLAVIKPRIFTDARGYFYESFSEKEFHHEIAAHVRFVQDNQSFSSFGVVRGLHFQRPPFAQAKLVRCVEGRVLDIAVDIRKGSPTYGRHLCVELSGDNHLQFFIPRGFAHGFAVLSETALFQYKCDNYYHPDAEGGLSIFDPALGLDLPVDSGKKELSEKDRHHPLLAEFITPFEYIQPFEFSR